MEAMNRSAETLHYIIEEWAAHIEGLIAGARGAAAVTWASGRSGVASGDGRGSERASRWREQIIPCYRISITCSSATGPKSLPHELRT